MGENEIWKWDSESDNLGEEVTSMGMTKVFFCFPYLKT